MLLFLCLLNESANVNTECLKEFNFPMFGRANLWLRASIMLTIWSDLLFKFALLFAASYETKMLRVLSMRVDDWVYIWGGKVFLLWLGLIISIVTGHKSSEVCATNELFWRLTGSSKLLDNTAKVIWRLRVENHDNN